MGQFAISVVSQDSAGSFDVVFVHGLGGSPSDSWSLKPKGSGEVLWPTALRPAIGANRVALASYPTSKVGKLLGGNDMSFMTVAAGVADSLASNGFGNRPLVFVAHSLGGLVVKALLRRCEDSTDPRWQKLYASTAAVILFGCPNSGATLGSVCANVPGLTSLQSKEIARADSVVTELDAWFRKRAGSSGIAVHSFFETEPTNGIMVVDAASANPVIDGCEPVPVPKNHIDICKIDPANDDAFTSVVSFIKSLSLDEKGQAELHLRASYLEGLFSKKEITGSADASVDERAFFVDPSIYHENKKTWLTELDDFVSEVSNSKASIVTGKDRSGKTLLSKLLQVALDQRNTPAIRLAGRAIQNAAILNLIDRAERLQYGEVSMDRRDSVIIIDDFDECELPEAVKESIVHTLSQNFSSIIITSFSHSPSVLFASEKLADPELFEISPLGDEKLLELSKKWRKLAPRSGNATDQEILTTFDTLQKLFVQTEVEKYPGSAVSFLQLIDSTLGSDIAFSSYAACYETMISAHISRVKPNWQGLDEGKNFISFVAYTAYTGNPSGFLSSEAFEYCLRTYKDEFFSSIKDLRDIAIQEFLETEGDGYVFREEYEWHFLCARHVAREINQGNSLIYQDFIDKCCLNIFRKQYANMIIFIAYFSNDNSILERLLGILDRLFSGAASWELSDEQKVIMLGLTTGEQLSITTETDFSESRAEILKQKVLDIIDEAEGIVAKYTLPFLSADIADSEIVEVIRPDEIGADSYMRSLNALMRIHSVIGQILSSRSGTFDARTMVKCITRMVQASGRYVALNHAIAAVLVHDKQKSLDDVDRAYDNKRMTKEEKFEKVERIFSFWSVYVSQAGLARYLSQDHAIRALRWLVGEHESEEKNKGRPIPYNFTSVLIIASLYKQGELDKDLIEKTIEKYGEQSSLLSILRVAVHFYSYYMPLNIKDKQWLGSKLKMPLQRIEVQQRKALVARRGLPSLPPADKAGQRKRRPRRVQHKR